MTLEELEKLKELQALNSERSTMTRVGVGLANALTGIGASPDVANAAIKKGGDYLKATEPAPIKDLKVVDVDGKPVYMTPDKANMEMAYQAPKGGGGGKGSFQAISYYDPKTKKYGSYKFNTSTGDVEEIDTIIRPTPEKMFKMEDMQGNVTQNTYNQYNPGSSKVIPQASTKGIGAHYNVATEGQAKIIEKGIEEGQKKYQETAESLNDVKNSKKIISTTNDPRLAASAIYDMVRRIEPKGVLTDQDFVTITGQDKMTFLARLQEAANTNVFGDVQSVMKTYGPLVDNLEKKLQARVNNIPNTYAPSTDASQGAYKNVVPKNEGTVKTGARDRVLNRLKGQ